MAVNYSQFIGFSIFYILNSKKAFYTFKKLYTFKGFFCFVFSLIGIKNRPATNQLAVINTQDLKISFHFKEMFSQHYISNQLQFNYYLIDMI